jgi:hypothetical protein
MPKVEETLLIPVHKTNSVPELAKPARTTQASSFAQDVKKYSMTERPS